MQALQEAGPAKVAAAAAGASGRQQCAGRSQHATYLSAIPSAVFDVQASGACLPRRVCPTFRRIMFAGIVTQALYSNTRVCFSLAPCSIALIPAQDHASNALCLLWLKLISCHCSVSRTVAAMRLAETPAAIEQAKQEAAVYVRLEHLQGQCIPRLLAHGPTLEGRAYYVATEYILVGVLVPFLHH